MERPDIPYKWRPSLLLVIATCLTIVFVLPVAGFVVLRWITPILGWKLSVTWVSLGLLVATATVGFLQWRLLLRPIQDLARSSQMLATERVEHPVPMKRYGTSELRDLGGSVLAMASGLLDQQKALRGYADHVVHELKTPVTALNGAAELLQEPSLSSAHKAALLKDLQVSAQRMDDLLNMLRLHAQARAPQSVGLTMVRDLQIITSDDVHVHGKPRLGLEARTAAAILEHLITNARQAGATRIDVCETAFGVRIGDNGRGLSDTDVNHVFDPFFTTKRESGGTGMGLSIVKSLVESGGGTVALWRKCGGVVVDLHV